MRQLTQNEISKLQTLTSKSVEVSLIEPTNTGLQKSIMDATQPIREFLKTNGVHDYQLQGQGPEHKKLVNSHIITADGVIESKASLYRPQTKSGDPRIWFSGLTAYCRPNDILGILFFENSLWVFNLTKIDVDTLLRSSGPFKQLLDSYEKQDNEIALELLGKLRAIALKGFIPASVDADTAVGRLLETELQIPINSSRNPDYKGIEIKSFRSERNNRKNLFAQVPDWGISKYKSSKEMLDAYGYIRDDIKRLYCTVSSQNFNSQSLKLRVNENSGLLAEFSQNAIQENALVWRMEKLNERLLEKHSETFWVKAEVRRNKNQEEFKFISVEYTKSPIVTQLGVLLGNGEITLDHLIKEKGASAVEKGPIFKLKHNSLPLLFPPSQTYIL